MTIPALPALDRTSPTFKAELDGFFLTKLPATVTALNAELTRIDGITPVGFTGTSTTSLAITGAGSVTLTTQANKGFAAGQLLLVAVTAAPGTQMKGVVTSYNASTGELVFSSTWSAGTGTYDAWTVSLTAPSPSLYSPGDILRTNRTLSAPDWLPADSSVYAQSSYSALYSELGLIKDGLNKPFSSGSATTQAALNVLYDTPQGFASWPLVSFGSYALLYTKATGAANSKFARTTDGGATWTDITLPTTATDASYYRVVSHDGGTTLVAAHNSTDAWVAQSSDGGLTWNTRNISGYPGGGQLFVLNGVYIIMNSAGTTMWKSPDGITWSGHITPVALTCMAVLTYQGSQVAVATTGAAPWTTIYTSSANGLTWTARTIPSISSYYYATSLVSVNNVFVWMLSYLSAPGTYQRSEDGGVTWTTRTIPAFAPSPNHVTKPMQVFDGRFVTPTSYGGAGCTLMSSVDGLTWDLKIVPVSVDAITHDVVHKVVNGSLYLLDAVPSAITLYRLDSWKSAWAESFLGHNSAARANWYLGTLCETANYQLALASYTTTAADWVWRRPLYTYNTATQFAVPAIQPIDGATTYIKA